MAPFWRQPRRTTLNHLARFCIQAGELAATRIPLQRTLNQLVPGSNPGAGTNPLFSSNIFPTIGVASSRLVTTAMRSATFPQAESALCG